MLRIETATVGALATNCYLVGADEADCILMIDPGGEPQALLQQAARIGKSVQALLLTHGHVDHIAAAAAIQRATAAKVYAHAADAEIINKPDPYWASLVGGAEGCRVDVELGEGDQLHLAGLDITVMHTPGHSPGGVCFVTADAAFCGDTLFAGSIGRTDLPGGDEQEMVASLTRLVSSLADDTRLYPGHGAATTMRREQASNPFLQTLPGV